MPDFNPLTLTPVPGPAAVTFAFDVLISARVIAADGTVVLDTTEAPVSLVDLLAHCAADDLQPVIDQFALTWLIKQRGPSDGVQ